MNIGMVNSQLSFHGMNITRWTSVFEPSHTDFITDKVLKSNKKLVDTFYKCTEEAIPSRQGTNTSILTFGTPEAKKDFLNALADICNLCEIKFNAAIENKEVHWTLFDPKKMQLNIGDPDNGGILLSIDNLNKRISRRILKKIEKSLEKSERINIIEIIRSLRQPTLIDNAA